jgi:hypothetical protein
LTAPQISILDANVENLSETFIFIFHHARQQVQTSAAALFNILVLNQPTLLTRQNNFIKRVIECVTFHGAANQNPGRQPG